jgi:Fe-S-cluster containining protein
MSKDEKRCSIVCQRCGRCCRASDQMLHGDTSLQDIACWIGDNRWDILEWVGPMTDPDSEDAMFDIWVNPKTQDFAKRCPWLRKKEDSKLYECSIYDVRPAGCRKWPQSIDVGQELGCPACKEKSDGVGKEIKVVEPGRGDD